MVAKRKHENSYTEGKVGAEEGGVVQQVAKRRLQGGKKAFTGTP